MPSHKMLAQLDDQELRREFIADQVTGRLAEDIRRRRKAKGMTQADLGEAMGTHHANVGRIENPDYGRLTLRTLIAVAAALDCGVRVELVDLPKWLDQ